MSNTHYHLGTHTELGDLLVLEGLIRHFSFATKVTFNTQYVADAKELFHPLKNVEPIFTQKSYPVRPDKVPRGANQVLWLGYFSEEFQKHGRRLPGIGVQTFDPKTWDREFYRQAGVPFITRWRGSRLPGLYGDSTPEDAILVHDEPEHRIALPNARRITPLPGKTVFAWMKPLSQAREIHCIDSSILSLVESMWANGYFGPRTEFFFHRSVRPTHPPTLLAPWQIVE
jgi:hypothetical protein